MDDRILKFADSRQFIGRIARSGENNTRSLVFDCSAALAEYPTSQIIAVIQRPQGDPYTVTPDADGTIRRITLTSYDLEFNGHLQIELRVIDGNKILKSAIYTATVDDSIRGEADAPGQPVRDVLDRLEAEIKQAQAVVDDIRQKLENGEFNGSDAEVTAENIQSALGYAPVKDVQIAGTSILADGVANVPVATKTVNGVMRPDFCGVGVSDVGILYVQNISNINITNRVSSAPLTAYNLDYAVKAAMCDGKGAAWTSVEQQAARDRIGVHGEFELIEEITLSEEVTNVAREAYQDGTPYNLRSLIVVVDSTNVENRPTMYGWARLNAKLPSDEWEYISTGEFISTYNCFSFFVYRVSSDGSVDSYFTSATNTMPTGFTTTRWYIPRNVIRFGMHINDFSLYSTDKAIPANTKIAIYGVRA